MKIHRTGFLSLLSLVVFVLLTPLASAQSSAFVGGECVSINGMYVSLGNGNSGILGDFTQETELLEFAEKNGFNYLIFYDLEGMSGNSQRQTQLANLISRGRASYGIQQVAAALGAASSADEVAAYNTAHAADERIDVLNLEYEFWNDTDRTTAFNNTLNILSYFESVADDADLETEIYIGWINEQEGIALANAVDRILVHYYRQNDTNILQYGMERLEYLAAGNANVKIAPIFSNEGPTNTGDPTAYFMGPWLETHAIDQPFKTWITEYHQLGENWQQQLEVMGGTWFLYNYFEDIDAVDSDHLETQPQSTTACEGDTISLSLSSSAVDRDIGWMKDGRCLVNGGAVSGAGTASLTLSNVTASDFGDYRARVISYDTANPSSHLSDVASVSLDATCTPSSANVALGKTTTASSHIAAGYEPSLINDGDTDNTRWASEYTGDQWIQVDLGQVHNINAVTLYWDAAYAVDYQILVSEDGSQWQNLRTVSGNVQLVNHHDNLSVATRFVRINGTQKALPQWGFSLYELEVYGYPIRNGSCNTDL